MTTTEYLPELSPVSIGWPTLGCPPMCDYGDCEPEFDGVTTHYHVVRQSGEDIIGLVIRDVQTPEGVVRQAPELELPVDVRVFACKTFRDGVLEAFALHAAILRGEA